MKNKLTLLLFLFSLNTLLAQKDYLKFKPYHPYTWMVGAGWSFVDNDGRPFSDFFDLKNGYSLHPYPTQVHVDRYFKYGLSVELTGSFNHFKGNTIVNVKTPNPSGNIWSIDLATRYSIYQFLYKKAPWFDPYVAVGLGFTSIKTRDSIQAGIQNYATLNGGIGVNFWIRNFGIRLQGLMKFGIVENFYHNSSNYVHYSATLMYRFQQPERRDNSFSKAQHKWTRKKPGKYKGSSR